MNLSELLADLVPGHSLWRIYQHPWATQYRNKDSGISVEIVGRFHAEAEPPAYLSIALADSIPEQRLC
jgi:hypothetical protein